MSIQKRIFVCYAREDENAARKLCSNLKAEGLNPWLDKESLLPGQNWRLAIQQAIRESSYFLALLSSRSVTKRGFVQREIREALEVMSELPEGEIFLIPVRLDDCKPSHQMLCNLQWVDMFPSWLTGLDRLLKVIHESKEERLKAHKYPGEERQKIPSEERQKRQKFPRKEQISYKFPDGEWVQVYKEALNGASGRSWQKAAHTWVVDFMFVIEPDWKLEEKHIFYFDIFFGKCRDARRIKDFKHAPHAEFEISGPYSTWLELIRGEFDLIRGIVLGKFKTKGDVTFIMEHGEAFQELAHVLQNIGNP